MSNYQAIFNPLQFEARGYTNDYLTESQRTKVAEVEQRVDAQLDWLAQLLGWNGPNYWSNLVSNVSQKRRLLGGSFGVYESYYFPRVVSIKNWDPTAADPGSANLLAKQIYDNKDKLWLELDKDGQVREGQTVKIGDNSWVISEIKVLSTTILIPLEGDTEQALLDFQNGLQVRISDPDLRPEPFSRPQISTSGDASFRCKKVDGELQLFPYWDFGYSLPYYSNILMVGSTYYFDQPVYVARNAERVIDGDLVQYPQDIVSSYDSLQQRWYLTIPPDFASGEVGTGVFLVWLYSDPALESFCAKEITLQRWSDPSDWGETSVLEYYTGTWGNKGGPLPFHFVFDSLEVQGFDEQKSLFMSPLSNRVSFDELLNFVYYQKISTDVIGPGEPEAGQVWWDSTTGSFSVWRKNPYGCGSWDEVLYPQPAVNKNRPEFVFPTVANFRFSQDEIEPGVLVEIEDISGLAVSDNVLGLSGTLNSPGSLKLYKQINGEYWVPFEFVYLDELDFDQDSLYLPSQVPVLLQDATDLGTTRTNYIVENLKFVIDQALPVQLLKTSSNKIWNIRPSSDLKYIGNTRLFGSDPNPLNGAMTWNYDIADEELRMAAVYYYSSYELVGSEYVLTGAWVDINTGEQVNPPPADLNFGVIKVYCDGELVGEEVPCQNDSFSFWYQIDQLTGEFIFNYQPLSFYGIVNKPKITISDSLTGVFTFDITEYVYSGSQIYMSPNVYDCKTTLRLWKPQELFVEGEKTYEKDTNYSNILRADENNGPGADNWQRYFVRMPPSYERNGPIWQKVALTCQDFGYWGTSVIPENMDCPSETQTPSIYEQVFLYKEENFDTYVMYSEPYLFSDIAFVGVQPGDDYENAAILPSVEEKFDDFTEGSIKTYEPLHERRSIVNLPVGRGYGNWEGVYLRSQECTALSGFLTKDLLENSVSPIEAPLWDASVYKLPPSCEVNSDTYKVDANNYKIGYAYFAADLSCAEDGFFDVEQEAAWRYPVSRPKTLYLTPEG